MVCSMFNLDSEYDTAGDQEQAIEKLVEQIESSQELSLIHI